ncbi:hypothetical protein PR202_ga11674 [Eleusine coracana subsp. coracana]|uniref:Uncharacterized protein n=1 Tax=Eleusine coracana subsp. coracana TaxID=191504 RepID=A0AAV5CA69_ELECO|nr:hypothetical protein PR202_ga11674 [Eleusine coracana subsp. coracana]
MGGGGAVTPTSTPSSPSCSSEILPPEFTEYVAVSPVSDGDESDECCVCDDAEVEALHYASRRLQDRSLREAKDLIRRKFQIKWHNLSSGVPNSKESNAICIYDTQSLSSNPKKNFEMLHQWVTKGVSHGEMTTWDADDGTMIKDIKPSVKKYSFLHCKTRKVNFVIFVVDGTSVLKSIDGENKEYTEILRETFMYPFLSIGDINMITINVTADDKPIVVVTHGDRLSMKQRAHVQNELAELLGIPVQQIFDTRSDICYTGSDDYQTDLAILDMLRYCIQHAEQNLPIKLNYLLEV